MGFFTKARKALISKPLKKVEKHVLRPVIKHAPKIIGTVAGTALGGPLGGIIGGGIGGATQRGGHNRLKGFFHGAGVGAAYQALAPMMASHLGMDSPIMSSVTGLNSPSLLNQIGFSNAPSMGGGIGLFGNAGNKGLLNRNSLLGMGQAAKDFSGRLSEIPQPGSHYEMPPMDNGMDGNFSEIIPGQPINQNEQNGPKTINFSLNKKNPDESPLDILMKLSPNIPFRKHKKSQRHKNESQDEDKKPKQSKIKFASGGLSKKESTGHIKESYSGGQDDDIDMTIPEGAYVLNATDLSLFGDGSTDNGVEKAMKFEQKYINQYEKKHKDRFVNSGITSPHDSYGIRMNGIKAKVSNDEYVLDPRAVTALGKGNNQKGAKTLDGMRKNLRSHKGVKSILPPKSKALESYMRGGR